VYWVGPTQNLKFPKKIPAIADCHLQHRLPSCYSELTSVILLRIFLCSVIENITALSSRRGRDCNRKPIRPVATCIRPTDFNRATYATRGKLVFFSIQIGSRNFKRSSDCVMATCCSVFSEPVGFLPSAQQGWYCFQ